MPRGALAQYLRALFGQKESICLGKKTIIIASKHGTTIFFPITIFFLGKLKEKLARKARLNTERVFQIDLMPIGHLIKLLKSN